MKHAVNDNIYNRSFHSGNHNRITMQNNSMHDVAHSTKYIHTHT